MFTNIDEALNWLFTQKKTQKRENLDRIKLCVNRLNCNPDYKIAHIAGTNGKGSTASNLKNIMVNTGKRVGLFVSPFVVCFNERIQINNEYIKDYEILNYLSILKIFSDEYKITFEDTIPFFELTLLMALMYFKDNNVDMAVIECGLGGKLDATNFINPDITIITNVGFDHMNSLGDELSEIAEHKLGIAKPGKVCLTCVEDQLRKQFNTHAKNNNVEMIYVNDDVKNIILSDVTQFTYKEVIYLTPLLATYQAFNAALAIEAAFRLDPSISSETIQKGLNETFWPGRMEVISKEPLVIIDGAHNIHGICGLVDSLKVLTNKKIKVVFTALSDKEYKAMVHKLEEVTEEFYFTTINDNRAMDIELFNALTSKKYLIIDDFKDCIDLALSTLSAEECLLITGSLHFISAVRQYLLQ